MKYFGPSWYAPVCEEQVATPVDDVCMFCDEVIAEGDQGLFIGGHSDAGYQDRPVHIECHVREIVGSVGHLSKRCSCYGGNEDDPEGMSKREAAIEAYKLWKQLMVVEAAIKK
jgi:hypothetical protein